MKNHNIQEQHWDHTVCCFLICVERNESKKAGINVQTKKNMP